MSDVIQSMWIGDRLSAMERVCAKSFLHHGHPFHLYVYGDVANVPEGTTVLDANTILPESRVFKHDGGGFGNGSYAGFSDLFRYKVRGWVDMDAVCVKPFEFATEYVLSGDISAGGYSPGVAKTPLNSPFVSWLYEEADRRCTPGMVYGRIGPQLITEAVRKFEMEEYLYPWELFYPVRDNKHFVAENSDEKTEELCRDSYSIHFFNEMWRQTGWDKDGHYPPDCLYERFLRQYGIR